VNYQTSMTLQANADTPLPPFVRLANVENPTGAEPYVDFFAAAQTVGTTRLGIGVYPATYSVDFTMYRLRFSRDTSVPKVPVPPAPGLGLRSPVGPTFPLRAPPVPSHPPIPRPVIPVYVGQDGTPLKVAKNPQGQITGFSGTANSQITYTLDVKPSFYSAQGRIDEPAAGYPVWVNMTATFSQQPTINHVLTDSETFKLRINYCPWENFAAISFSRLDEDLLVYIALDLSQLLNGYTGAINGDAGLTRGVSYFLKNFGTDQSQMPCGNVTSDMYLPAYVSMWPVQDMLWYFDDALDTFVNGLDILPPAHAPLMNFAQIQNMMEWGPKIPLADFLSKSIPLLGAAVGPLISVFISPNDPMDPINRLAYWFGWELSSGLGQTALTAALTDYYNRATAFANQGGGVNHPRIPELLPVSGVVQITNGIAGR
jgi:hypothetical protein